MLFPDEFKYTKDHEWVEVDRHKARVGITDYAQDKLGDVVFVELPDVGETFKAGDVFGTIESVKAVSDLFAPISGEVIEINNLLDSEPELVNNDPNGDGWMIVLSISDPAEIDELMEAEEYETFLENEDEDEEEDIDEDEDEDEDDD